jgi:hypothetical protein
MYCFVLSPSSCNSSSLSSSFMYSLSVAACCTTQHLLVVGRQPPYCLLHAYSTPPETRFAQEEHVLAGQRSVGDPQRRNCAAVHEQAAPKGKDRQAEDPTDWTWEGRISKAQVETRLRDHAAGYACGVCLCVCVCVCGCARSRLCWHGQMCMRVMGVCVCSLCRRGSGGHPAESIRDRRKLQEGPLSVLPERQDLLPVLIHHEHR